jgi:carbon-monoxide dehydrogenase large subunit
MAVATSPIGAPVPRVEGPEKVTGRARYTADVALPGTLWGKILRSPYPHARIVRIDATAAGQVPGVRAVVTGQDLAGRFIGKTIRDMPVLCWDTVRFVGDRVAAVAAETPEAADAALDALQVEYAELPAVFDPLAAMQPDAPLLHADVASYEGAPAALLATDVRNGVTRLLWTKGDVARGFREADLVLEHTFRVPSRHQGYIEPHASLVAIDADGRLQVWASTKCPFRVRTHVAKALGLAEERVRVNPICVGGDFGGKGDALDVPVAYFLAQQAGRPVRFDMTHAEDLTSSNPTHPTVVTVRSGVTRDGRIVARAMRTVHASGAYAGLKPNGFLSTRHYVGGAYRVPHASFEFLQVYTNTVPGGYLRAPGAHQHTFALECHTDLLAEALSMDPAEFRLRNIIGEGEEDAVGTRLGVVKAREVLQAALDAAGWGAPRPGPHRGRGIALFGREIGGGAAGAILTAEPDGTLTVLSPTFDQGAGTHTIVQQIVAAEMGLPLERIRVEVGDTDTSPYDEGTRSSRVTYTEGQSVLEACGKLRARLAEHAAELLYCPEAELAYRDGAYWSDDRQVSLAEVVARAGRGRPVTVRVELDAAPRPDVAYYCAQVADVEVDPETGQVRVHRLVSAHDVGTIINPITHQGQIDGGAVQGLGLALTEELVMDAGRITTAHLGEYKLPTAGDVPPLETVLVPSDGGIGPHAAKSIGELANNNAPAAVANAVADAVGARLFELPLTAERVYRALQTRDASGSNSGSGDARGQ